jgi:hypothetical protein
MSLLTALHPHCGASVVGKSTLLAMTWQFINKKAVRKMDSPFLIQVENLNVTSALRSRIFPCAVAWPWSLSPLGSRVCISWAIVYYVRCWMASGNPVNTGNPPLHQACFTVRFNHCKICYTCPNTFGRFVKKSDFAENGHPSLRPGGLYAKRMMEAHGY